MERGKKSEGDGDEQGDARGEDEHAGVDPDLVEPRYFDDGEPPCEAHPDEGHDDAEEAASSREEETLGKDLSHQLDATRPECSAQSDSRGGGS